MRCCLTFSSLELGLFVCLFFRLSRELLYIVRGLLFVVFLAVI